MKQQHLLVVLSVMVLGAMILFGVLVSQALCVQTTVTMAPMPPSVLPQCVITSSALVPREMELPSPQPEATPIVSARTSAQVAVEKPVDFKKPFFYAVQPSDLKKLNEEQQKLYAGTQQEYIEFYDEWNNKWPHDPEAWNKKMTELQQDLAMRIGAEGMDNLLR